MKSGFQRNIQKASMTMVNEIKTLEKHELAPCRVHRKLLGGNGGS